MSNFFLICCRDQEVNAAPLQRFRGSALKEGGNASGIVAIRVAVARVPAHTPPCSASSPPGAGPSGPWSSRGAQERRDGDSRLRGPGDLASGLPSAGRGKGERVTRRGVIIFSRSAMGRAPNREASPSPWLGSHETCPSQAGDGHLRKPTSTTPPAPIFPASSCP